MSQTIQTESEALLPAPPAEWKRVAAGAGTALALMTGGVGLAWMARPAPAQPQVARVPVDGPQADASAVNASFGQVAPVETVAEPEFKPDLMGPPALQGPPVPDRLRPRRTARAGGIGPMGPLVGPLNTQLDINGPVRGPQWTGVPLPDPEASLTRAAGQPAPAASSGTQASPSGPKTAVARPDSSELPTTTAVTLSQQANPQLPVRAVATKTASGQATAEHPLSLRLSVGRAGGTYQVGDMVAARMSSETECYIALIRVDAGGKASTIFRSPGPGRSFACAFRAGPQAGPEYLLALASIHPLSGSESAAALRGSGATFVPMVWEGEGGVQPAAAWSEAVGAASTYAQAGGASKWQRYEYAVSTASFVTRSAAKAEEKSGARAVAGSKPEAKPASKPKDAAPAPPPVKKPDDGSVLPSGAQPEPKPDAGSEPKAAPSDTRPSGTSGKPALPESPKPGF